MSLANQPPNFSYANADKFTFTISKIPGVTYFLDAIVFPQLQFDKVDVPSPFKKIPYIGDELSYSNLSIRFGIDEDFRNYKEIFNWIKDISNSSDFTRYPNTRDEGDGIYADGSLVLLNNNFKPNVSFTFTNIFPLSLNLLSDLNIENEVTEYLRAEAEFAVENIFLDE